MNNPYEYDIDRGDEETLTVVPVLKTIVTTIIMLVVFYGIVTFASLFGG